MTMDFPSLEARYLNSCKKHSVIPNSTIQSCFSKSKMRKPGSEKLEISISMDELKDFDVLPLIDALMESHEGPIVDAIDVSLHETRCGLRDQSLIAFFRSVDSKLRVVDLHEMSIRNELLRDLCVGGLACEVLNLRSDQIRKLDISGKFSRLRTLNLDFCTALTSLEQGCFSLMPILLSLSVCETRIGNLWTTCAALSKLPSLRQLRFQNCLCCEDTNPCPSSGEVRGDERSESSRCWYGQTSLSAGSGDSKEHVLSHGGIFKGLVYRRNSGLTCEVGSYLQDEDLWEISEGILGLDGKENFQNEIGERDDFVMNVHKQEVANSALMLRKYMSHHPSPICFERHYRHYMVASLPRLEVLDNMLVTEIERAEARSVCGEHFESLPYKRRRKESVVSLLHKRETGASRTRSQKNVEPKYHYPFHANQWFFSRSLCAAKLGSCDWPILHPLSKFSKIFKEQSNRPRPRQLEYHPSDPSLMAFGTLGGEVIAINHENGNTIRYIPPVGATSSVLGLCWLKKYPSKLIAGSDNGSLRLFDINYAPSKEAGSYYSSSTSLTFKSFEHLTSLHVNSTDDKLLASGYSKDVALYDLETGNHLQTFSNIHKEPINVVKFALHSPYLFATSSFDRDVKMWDLRQNPLEPCFTAASSRGNVMVCFSPDDLYLLVSAVDNEVKQLSAADGRLIMNLEIASTGSAHNYTRSYYMNGRDYIISGSCDEHVVRICCAQTGKRLRDVYLEDLDSGNSMFVQSLRSDPFRDFNMSVLAASTRPSSKWEIIKINLLASSVHYAEECSNGGFFSTS